MKFLLKLKAWQLFLLIVVPIAIKSSIFFYEVFALLGGLLYLTWVYEIGIAMHSFISEQPKKPRNIYFKISFTFMVLSLIIHYILSYVHPVDFYFSFTLAIILVICMLYFVGFSGRMLESKITGRIENRSDSLKAMLFIYFFPIGIWYLQPIINQIVAKEEQTR